MTERLKRVLHVAGSAFALMGVGFVAARLYEYSGVIQFREHGAALGWLLAFGTLIYAITNSLLGFAWWNILSGLGVKTRWLWAQRVYGLSQLAKYVPGNVFHFAGRQALGMAAGVSGTSLIKSSMWELGLLSLAGGFFSFLVLPYYAEYVSWWLSLSLGALLFIVIIFLLKLIFKNFSFWALASYIVFLMSSGSVFAFIAAYLSDDFESFAIPWMVFIGAYVVAWLVGLITPGAPAGVGVRELVLLFFLKDLISEPNLLLAVFFARVVTVFGDILYFLFSLLLPSAITNDALPRATERRG